MRKIELLAPARDAEIGKEAFNHGADAVYIGAPRFSARAAAGNDIQDIESLAAYGHQFGAKTIVAFNTIMTNKELEDAEQMAWKLYDAGVDALIIQDLGLLKLNLPPIELHASTQTDNRTIEKVRLMHQLGMTRVVMARELTVDQIKEIHNAVPDVELECFVHGALCVCVSGQCYLSAALTGRSANRGECAQPCRLPMDLEDSTGRVVARQKHLLSLKDMNRSRLIENLIDAGVMSLKIEGRLKDMGYVKNVTAYYRRLIDSLIEKHNDWKHVSEGRVYYNFDPVLEKSFNRGFTEYQENREHYWNFETPKAVGEFVGKVGKVYGNSITISAADHNDNSLVLSNGDGLLVGTVGLRANRIEADRVFPAKPDVIKDIKPGMEVWRNLDYKFEQILAKPTAKRKIPVDINLKLTGNMVTLSMTDGHVISEVNNGPFDKAEKLQMDNYAKQLSKLGDTIFELNTFTCDDTESKGDLFIPSSVLSEMRRAAVSVLMHKRAEIDVQRRHSYKKPDYEKLSKSLDARDIIPSDFRSNALNDFTKEILSNLKLKKVDNAFEIQQNADHPVMLTRHCIKYALGHCPKCQNKGSDGTNSSKEKWVEPMKLKIGNKKFILKFGCKNDCMSEIFINFAR